MRPGALCAFPVLAIALWGGCDRSTGEPDPPPPAAKEEESGAAPETTPAQRTAPAATVPLDAEAADVYIERLADRVYWVGTEVATELAFEIANGQIAPKLEEQALVLPSVERSVLGRLGLQEGDRLLRIDGHSAADLSQLRAAFHAVRDGKTRFAVELERGGQSHTIHMRFRPERSSYATRFDKAMDVLAEGVRLIDANQRAVDREVLVLLSELLPRRRSQTSGALELFGLPEGGEVMTFAGQTIVGSRSLPRTLTEALQSAKELETFEVNMRDGRVYRFEVATGLISPADLEAAKSLLPSGRSDLELDAEPGTVDTAGETEAVAVEVEAIKENVYRIDRASLEAALANPSLLARSARVIPHRKDGVMSGFKLYGIRKASPERPFSLASFGFENGDLVKSINGNEFTGVEKVMETYTVLRRAEKLEIELERRGKPMTIEIQIR